MHTLELASVMARRGHAVTIVQSAGRLYERPILERRLPVEVRTLSLGSVGLRSLGADIGVLVKGSFETGSALSDAAHRLAFPRFVTIEHSTPGALPPRPSIAAGLRPRFGIWWYREALRHRARAPWPHLTICVSEAVRTRLVTDSRFSPTRARTVHNGVDIEQFSRSDVARRQWREHWDIAADALVFGAVGRLSPTKNFGVAVEGFVRATAAAKREAWLVLVGDGPQRGAIEAAAKTAGLGARVVLPGPSADPASIYSAFDVFVMPSVTEGLPFALLEGMACECAPIAFAVGGIPEVLTDPAAGWLVPRADGAAFASAMQDAALLRPDRLREIGRAARATVAANFNAAVQYAVLADLLERETGLPAFQKR